MAAIEMPAADERIAVFEIKELPGRASIIDWALVLGSGCCEGTFDWYRTDIEVAGTETLERAEARRRPVPTKRVSDHYSMKEAVPWDRNTRKRLHQPHRHGGEDNSEMLSGVQVCAGQPSSVVRTSPMQARYPPVNRSRPHNNLWQHQ